MKYAFMEHHSGTFLVSSMSRALHVSRSGFYAWLKQPVSSRGREDLRLLGLIRSFYAESGGQIGDTGVLSAGDHSFTVVDTQKSGNANVHYGSVQAGEIAVGDKVDAHVDAGRRQAIRLNHSATHLLNEALRDVLGDHIAQRGSLNAPDRLRFDFSHSKGLSAEELIRVEEEVNAFIRQNAPGETRENSP